MDQTKGDEGPTVAPVSPDVLGTKERYLLRSSFIVHFEHELSSGKFQELKRARSLLSDCVHFEETVLQIIYALEEFEAFLLNTALNFYLFPASEYDAVHDTRLKANLKVLGYLSSLKSFKDQFPKFKGMSASVDVRQEFRQLWEERKQASTAFSFCERFRNYAQHQTQPASMVSIGGGWNEKRDQMEEHTSIFADVDDVCTNRDIGRDERDRYVKEFGSKCNVELLFRETAGCIGVIVKQIRSLLERDFAEATRIYEHNLGVPGAPRGVDAVTLVGDQVVEQFPVFPEFMERAKKLRKLRVMTNNQKHFISNRARPHRD